MAKIDLTHLLKTQISLTEWFDAIDHTLTQEIREEDNSRGERVKILNDVIGLPYDKGDKFPATVLEKPTQAFTEFVAERGQLLCGFRLLPNDPTLPKKRMRGKKLVGAIEWAKEQGVDLNRYTVDIVPHSNQGVYATIFVINDKGVFGEIIKGLPFQLTQGFHETTMAMPFYYDFEKLSINTRSKKIKDHILDILSRITVADAKKRAKLTKHLGVGFTNNYLNGYFETALTKEYGLWFIDYNRILGKAHENFVVQSPISKADKDQIRGNAASQGIAKGKVRIIRDHEVETIRLSDGEILVCEMTTPDYVVHMKQAQAIVTDLGGILSHAAIIARELNKPCIVGTQNATSMLADGDFVEVDAFSGTVRKL